MYLTHGIALIKQIEALKFLACSVPLSETVDRHGARRVSSVLSAEPYLWKSVVVHVPDRKAQDIWNAHRRGLNSLVVPEDAIGNPQAHPTIQLSLSRAHDMLFQIAMDIFSHHPVSFRYRVYDVQKQKMLVWVIKGQPMVNDRHPVLRRLPTQR